MIANFLRVEASELEEYKRFSELLENRVYSEEIEDDPNFIDIGKSWTGIIFLLTGQNFENATGGLSRIFFSGELIDKEQDLGYGPAHYLNSDEVKSLNDTISKIELEDLKSKFNTKRMTELEIYPQVWDRGDSEFEYLSENFVKLKEFYSEAVQNNQAVIMILN